MRKIFLEDLQHKEGFGKYKGIILIDWVNSISRTVRFIYDDIEGNIKIINYKKKEQKIIIEYNNFDYELSIAQLRQGKLGKCFGREDNYKYNINGIIETKIGKIKIIICFRGKRNEKSYKYQCLICKNIDTMTEGNLLKGTGCNVCSGRKVLRGINDINTTTSWMTEYLVNKEDGYNYTKGSREKVLMKCPNCKTEKQVRLDKLLKYGFSCPKCGDGISFCEKSMFNMLEQLNIDFKTHITFDWNKDIKTKSEILCGNKEYDFSFKLNNEDFVVETHGIQHYEKSFETCGGRTLEEEIENDRLKKELALSNGIKEENYIVIDCRESDVDFIKSSILKSNLVKLFDIDKVSWRKVKEYSISSKVREISNLWNEKKYTITEMTKITKHSRGAIRGWLKRGTELGLCDYAPSIKNSIREKLEEIEQEK